MNVVAALPRGFSLRRASVDISVRFNVQTGPVKASEDIVEPLL